MTEKIAGEVMVYQPITILEIDEDGMGMEAAFALRNDSLHEFRLVLPPRSVVVKGRVARCEIGELRDGTVLYRCRVEFVDPAPHVTNTIREFVAVHNAPRVIDGEITNT
jgi:hypothetical protein